MNKIKFRYANKLDINEIVDLFLDSFLDDPLMYVFNPDKKRHQQFVKSLFLVNTKTYLRRHICYVCEINGRIKAAVLVQKKDIEIGFLDYAKSGGWRLIRQFGVKKFIKFLMVFNEAKESLSKLDEKVWYIDSLAVSRDERGKGLGSRLLQEFVIPFVRTNGGGTIALITQNKDNLDFYSENGFVKFGQNVLENDEVKIDNFSFKQNVNKIN